jgi:hypothetical protein
MKCWAENVSSDCCKIQSNEHYISKGLFSSEMVRVSGFAFLKGETRYIPLKKLTRNCLCETHNNLLSPLDSEAKKLSEALEYGVSLHAKRAVRAPRKWIIHKREINYLRVKRWFIKTMLGMEAFFENDYPLTLDKDILAKLAFAEIDINSMVSLEISCSVGDDMVIDKVVSVAPIYSENECVGIEVELYGLKVRCFIGVHANHNHKKELKIDFYEAEHLSYVIRLQ